MKDALRERRKGSWILDVVLATASLENLPQVRRTCVCGCAFGATSFRFPAEHEFTVVQCMWAMKPPLLVRRGFGVQYQTSPHREESVALDASDSAHGAIYPV